MLKYLYTNIVFQEVPDEISLAIGISNCPNHCPGCHSPELQSDTGQPLNEQTLNQLISDNPGISCVLFMGGDNDPESIRPLISVAHKRSLKVALYTGKTYPPGFWPVLDYLKTGPYIESLGPLTSKTTNQRFYHIFKGLLIDKTYLFNDKRYQN